MTETADQTNTVARAAEIVAAYVSNNTVASAELGALIRDVHRTLRDLGRKTAEPEPLVPAVPIRKSVTRDYIICLEDGKKFRTLKRHLRVHYDLTPKAYRERWGLPADYPMVAPGYSAARSEQAKSLGLGQLRRTAAAAKSVAKGAASKTRKKDNAPARQTKSAAKRATGKTPSGKTASKPTAKAASRRRKATSAKS